MRNNTCPCPLFVPFICLKMWVEAESQQSNMLVGAGTEASEVACGLVESGEVGGRLVFLKTEMFFQNIPIYLKISSKIFQNIPKNNLEGLGGGMAGSRAPRRWAGGSRAPGTRVGRGPVSHHPPF